jgi:hypothetical protein
VGERIAGSEGDQRQGGCDGGFKAARIAQSADQAVMSFNMAWVGGNGGNGGAEGTGGLGGLACSEQVKAMLELRIGSGVVGCCHVSSEDKSPTVRLLGCRSGDGSAKRGSLDLVTLQTGLSKREHYQFLAVFVEKIGNMSL